MKFIKILHSLEIVMVEVASVLCCVRVSVPQEIDVGLIFWNKSTGGGFRTDLT